MNTCNILWIDDDWNNLNSNEYKLLNSVKGEIEDKNNEITIECTDNIGYGLALIGRINGTIGGNKKIDLIIVDLNFSNSDKTDYSDLIESIRNKGKRFAIYTNHRQTYDDDLNDIREKCRDILIDIYEKGKCDKQFIEDIVQISNFNPITIVHLCDFHYDSSLTDKHKRNQDKLFENFIEFISNEHKNTPIDFFIFSGDFAAKNPQDDYKGAAFYLRKMIQETNNNFDKLLLVPGNHDVKWENYDQGLLSHDPGMYLKMFYEKLFDNSRNFITNLSGYNQSMQKLDTKEFDSFCFLKEFRTRQIKILGLNSVLLDPKQKGYGFISEDVIRFIKNKWAKKTTPNEFRIATFHHNVLPPFSKNDLDENNGIVNAGKIIELLSDLDCDLLLNGHCHFSGLYNFAFSSLGHDGYAKIKSLTTLSTGTIGGYSPQGDRARSFNIIRVFPTKDAGKKIIKVYPVIYDSAKNEWGKKTELVTDI